MREPAGSPAGAPPAQSPTTRAAGHGSPAPSVGSSVARGSETESAWWSRSIPSDTSSGVGYIQPDHALRREPGMTVYRHPAGVAVGAVLKSDIPSLFPYWPAC